VFEEIFEQITAAKAKNSRRGRTKTSGAVAPATPKPPAKTEEIGDCNAKAFESFLLRYVSNPSAEACVIKGRLPQKKIVITDKCSAGVEETCQKHNNFVYEEERQIEMLCKKYGLKCTFDPELENGRFMGYACMVWTRTYRVVLFNTDISRIRTIVANNKKAKSEEAKNTLKKESAGAEAVGKFLKTSIFVHIEKEIDTFITQEILKGNAKSFSISVKALGNVIDVGISTPGLRIFDKRYRLENFGYKDLQSTKQIYTVYSAFADYYEKRYAASPVIRFEKIGYITGVEDEYSSGGPVVFIDFSVKRKELKDLF